MIFIKAFLVVRCEIAWNGNNWASYCDFYGNDLSNAKVPGEQCGGRCVATDSCTHFTWTNFEGGTCWMKSGQISPNNAVESSDRSAVCGYIERGSNVHSGGDASSVVGKTYNGVLTTCHPATEAGACQLPEGNYVSQIYPVALGNIGALGTLKHNPGLCGHILRIDCGNGPVDIIVSNANPGGGLDLYASSWDLATRWKAPGQEWCKVQLTDRNPFQFNGPRCYYSPESEKENSYFHLLGIFNTGNRIVSSANLNGMEGSFNSITAYFAFYGGPVSEDASLSFRFTDGSTHNMRLNDCVKENNLHIWS